MIRIIVNPDSEVANKAIERLRENDGYCPCALEKTEDTKCICKDFGTSEELGLCHCGLYIRIDADEPLAEEE